MNNAERTFLLLIEAMFALSKFDMEHCPDAELKQCVSASIRCLHKSMLRVCTLCVPFRGKSKR